MRLYPEQWLRSYCCQKRLFSVLVRVGTPLGRDRHSVSPLFDQFSAAGAQEDPVELATFDTSIRDPSSSRFNYLRLLDIRTPLILVRATPPGFPCSRSERGLMRLPRLQHGLVGQPASEP